MAAVAAGPIDFEKPGKYPIVLSDALLGKPSNDVYTGIRYNHKPDISDPTSSSAHLQPSDDDPTSYDLSLKDKSDSYAYTGSRTTGNGQYVLIFDPVKKHFVLHRVDSTFDMNLISAPWAADTETLRSQYPQLEPQSKSDALRRQSKPAKPTAAVAKTVNKRPKAEKPKKKPAREPTPEPEDEDSDDGLTIEYPDGPSSQQYQYNSTPIIQRNVSEPSDEDSDADAEGDFDEEFNQDVDLLKLPSPANNNAGGVSDEDMELDLEAELEQALNEGADNGESSESEEE